MNRRQFIAAGSLMLLSACQRPAPAYLDPAAAAGIRTVALSLPFAPGGGYILVSRAELQAMQLPQPTAPQTAEVVNKRRTAFNAAMAGEKLVLDRELFEELTRAVQQAGYRIAPATRPAGAAPDTLRAEALLKMGILGAGYVDPLEGGAFGPAVVVTLTLVDARTGNGLMNRNYIYNGFPVAAGTTGTMPPQIIRLHASEQYRFVSLDAVMADPARAAAGLRAILPAISRDVIAALRNSTA